MQTPTISKKQAKKTLSGKKKRGEAIKNVLAKPFDSYWPQVSPNDNERLRETLSRALPRLKNENVKIPYGEIKGIPKNERRTFRQNYVKYLPAVQDVVIGVNDVSCLLESRQAGCVLVASDVQPRLLVQHILDQAVLYSVPILIVTDLRNILKTSCGISGCTVAIKDTIQPNSNLGLIKQTVSVICRKYPVPQTHINFHRKLDISTVTISDSGDEIYEVINPKLPILKNYHLARLRSERAFVPEETGNVPAATFLSLDDSPSPVLAENFRTIQDRNRNKKRYRSLSVKRVKGDKNRNKRKMEKFRGKKTKLLEKNYNLKK